MTTMDGGNENNAGAFIFPWQRAIAHMDVST